MQFEGFRHRWPFEDELLVVGGCCYAVSAFPSGGASLSPMSIQSAESSVESTKASRVVKRSIVIAGHKTSISLEDAFWAALKRIAQADGFTLSELVATITTRIGPAQQTSPQPFACSFSPTFRSSAPATKSRSRIRSDPTRHCSRDDPN